MGKMLRIIFYCTHAIFLSVALSGCSILAYERNYVPETQNSKLIQSSSSKENLELRNDNVVLTFHSHYELDSYPISIGPPILPIVPCFFLFSDSKNLHLEFSVQNITDILIFDVAKTKLIDVHGKIIEPYLIDTCSIDDKYRWLCSSEINDFKTKVTLPVTINKKATKFSIYYRNIDSEGDLKVQFGEMFSAGQLLKPQSLILKKHNNLAYAPFFLSGHEPVFR